LLECADAAKGVGVRLKIHEKTLGPVAAADCFAVDPDLFAEGQIAVLVVGGRTPFVTEHTHTHSPHAFAVGTGFGNRNTDLEDLGAEALAVVLTEWTVALAVQELGRVEEVCSLVSHHSSSRAGTHSVQERGVKDMVEQQVLRRIQFQGFSVELYLHAVDVSHR